ncbi:MAG: YeeE/YedE family protein [Hydrogenophaga sp.]
MSTDALITLQHWVLAAGFCVCLAFGYVIQRCRFCTMGALSDWINLDDTHRLQMWALALGLAMLGFQALSSLGWIDPLQTIYATGPMLWLSALVGGVLFGLGMVFASGCGSKTLARVGGGSLKALVVMLVMGVSALATMRGITAVLRYHTVDAQAVNLASGNTWTAWLGHVWSGAGPWLALAVALALIVWALRRGGGLGLESVLGGMGVAACVTAMWWVSGHLGFVAEHPDTLESVYLSTQSGRMESLSFSAPMALHLDWLMYFSDANNTLNLSVVSVWGVVLGAWLYARHSGTFRWEGFRDTQDTALHVSGGVLMGVGGVTAMGCTVGHGLSGLSTLSVVSSLAVAGIVGGAWLGFKFQLWLLERN